MKKPDQISSRVLSFRVNETELSELQSLVLLHGYPTISELLRTTCLAGRLVSHISSEKPDASFFKDRFNALVSALNEWGSLYDSFSEDYQMRARMMTLEGKSIIVNSRIEKKMESLLACTAALREEFAVLLAMIRQYLEDENNHGKA